MRVISSSVLRASAYEMHGPGPPRPVRECPARGREFAHRRLFLPPALPLVVPKSFTLGACGFSRPLKPDLVQFLWLPGTIVPGYFQPPYRAEG